MAKDKSSFVLYCDQIKTIEHLPDETAGKLFKLIYEYVNDKNPQTDDLILKIAFEPIRQQLKRDLKKYEKTISRRSESGKIGGIKSGEARRSKTKQNEAIASKVKQSEANEADNVNGTVNDNVNDIKEKGFAIFLPFTSVQFKLKWEEWVKYRKEIKKPYQTFSSQQAELEVLGKYTESIAIDMIKTALKNCWKNIRPLELSITAPEAIVKPREGLTKFKR
jgi:hypothetical protein